MKNSKLNLPSFWIQELTWQDVDKYLKNNDIVIVPIGSTEEHGPAGPLGVDSYAAIALAEDVAKKSGVLITPPLWFGDSSHHSAFPGTISLRPSTLIEVVKDVSKSLARHGFKKILIINGHKMSNLPALTIAAKELHEYELRDVLFAVIDPWKIARKISAEIKSTNEHHSGELEISHVWYKYPHLIRKNKLTNKKVNFEEIFSKYSNDDLFGGGGELIDILWNSYEQRSFTPTGSFSASIGASPEKGKKYHEYMVYIITDFIDWLKKYKGPIGNAKAK
ncbi:creatininase family protein [Candidatus Daviesbacteria bacterium]|nr:creatininase family protein [Candidatus Daviesbacteria bacterium]